jgi:cytochrome c551/c552
VDTPPNSRRIGRLGFLRDAAALGPRSTDVAAHYKSISDAQAQVVAHIRGGGQRHWGTIPMAPMSRVTDAQAAALAQYVLSR